MYSDVNEPFGAGRDASKLLFDFSILLSCLKKTENLKILDFAGGTGWVSEFLNRSGFDVTVFDIDAGSVHCIDRRLEADKRLDSSRMQAEVCNAHNLNFCENNVFGNIICYDSLHHMHNFDLVFKEMNRVLEPGGRVSFTEPGSKHADSKETLEFIKKYKSHEPDWIERSIFLEEINDIALKSGFTPLRIKPFLLPAMVDYSYNDWINFSKNKTGQKNYISSLISFNYESRVIFYTDKK